MKGALAQLDARLSRDRRAVRVPNVDSFADFLLHHARVKITAGPDAGRYTQYSFEGRESLIEICNVIDHVIGSQTGKALTDSTIVLAGGAQFGKTVLELNLAAYLAAVRFLSPGVYMPDDNLAAAIVDAKFRPDILDQIPWLAQMTQVGKAVNASGKSVNTKGAFLVTDGERKAVGLFRGLRKIPTSFSLDVVVRDEEDDIPRDKAQFLEGRMTASSMRLQIIVGTQRVHGTGQHKQWESGSQGVRMVGPVMKPCTGRVVEAHGHRYLKEVPPGWLNPEDEWPGICRCAVNGTPQPDDPRLGWEGDFRRPEAPDEVVATYTPDGTYYLAHPATGEVLDCHAPLWFHRRPDRLPKRQWSFRVAQIGTPAIDLSQIVKHWAKATGDAEAMVAFCCDRLAKPKSTAQALTPSILNRAREVDPYDIGDARTAVPRYAGLDTGDRCWFWLREVAGGADKRLIMPVQIALGDVVSRVLALCSLHHVSCLCIDERPAVSEARTLALMLNGLDGVDRWPQVDWKSRESWASFPSGLTWNGRTQRWQGMRCALVRFSKRSLGDGVSHSAHEWDENGSRRFVPLIECNRFEAIDSVVQEFLTPQENVVEAVKDAITGLTSVRQAPAMRLPRRLDGSPGILEVVDSHLLTGSVREKDAGTGELGEYVDGCENHLLLADAYSRLAEIHGGVETAVAPLAWATRSPLAAGSTLRDRKGRTW